MFMLKPMSASTSDVLAANSRPVGVWLPICAIALAGIAVVSSAFHFWPFEDSKAWQILCPPNFAAFGGIAVLIGSVLLKYDKTTVKSFLPHVSVLAYVGINILSIAFSSEAGRAMNFTFKLALMLLGGYALFSAAIYSNGSLRILYNLTAAAVIIAVTYCLIGRFRTDSEAFGFHGSALKYGTYIGILAPLCSVYLLASPKTWQILLGGIVSAAALASSGTLGALAAISTGMLTAMFAFSRWTVRLCVLGSLVLGFGALLVMCTLDPVPSILDDLRLAEADEVNLRQRYIEWQAEINLLRERTVTGTGAGCINDHRSKFYYRLPKLNTLKAFDQNGWLAAGAETGIAGLVCFCWIVLYYGKAVLVQVVNSKHKNSPADHRFAVAGFAGIAAACVANLFSSVHYNGVLIAFVLVLALISRANLLEKGTE